MGDGAACEDDEASRTELREARAKERGMREEEAKLLVTRDVVQSLRIFFTNR